MEGRRRLLLGDLPLRGAARWKGRGGCFWGISRCAVLIEGRTEEVASGGPPLRGAARRKDGVSYLWESSRCAGLLGRKDGVIYLLWGISCCAGLIDRGTEEAVSGKSPAARGCSMEEGSRIFYYSRPESCLLHLLWDALLFMPSLSAAITVEWAAKPQKRLPYQYVRTRTRKPKLVTIRTPRPGCS